MGDAAVGSRDVAGCCGLQVLVALFGEWRVRVEWRF